MRQIKVIGAYNSQGFDLSRISISGQGVTDETRNTVFQILRRMSPYIWLFDDGSPILFDDNNEILM